MRLILFGGFSFVKMWENIENGSFSGWLRPYWGNNARVDTAVLRSRQLKSNEG